MTSSLYYMLYSTLLQCALPSDKQLPVHTKVKLNAPVRLP